MSRAAGLLMVAGLAASVALAGDDAPQWLRDAAAAPPGTYAREVPAVVLLNDQQVIVEESGRRETRLRRVIRILNREGRQYATASRVYLTSTGKIKNFHGWMLAPGGAVVKYSKDRLIDVAAVNNDVYDEVRIRLFSAGDDAQDGSVFGYEMVDEDKSVFTQEDHSFQTRLPAVVSRYSLSLPAGWTARSITYNHATVEPQVSGAIYTWELRDLPFLEAEPHSPGLDAIAPRLAVSYMPPADNRAGLRAMTDWTAVSRWLTELSYAPTGTSGAVSDRARALTAGASSDLDKIRAIAAFVQGINYVSIQTGVGRGGGYRPHAAAQVIEKQYGDCKDKANLMRALLEAVGIPAYTVLIWAGDRSYVHSDWPSPQQFNHAIVAIKVGESVSLAPVLEHPQLGRLLFFDPTDPHTPLGDLPEEEQGSYALVVAGEQGALLKVPLLPASNNRSEVTVQAKLSERGEVEAVSEAKYFGQKGAAIRAWVKGKAPSDMRDLLERDLAQKATGVKLASLTHNDVPQEDRIDRRMEFTAPSFGHLTRGRLLVMKPGLLVFREEYFLTAKERKLPVELTASLRTNTVKVQVPEGFNVDELAEPVDLAGPYGTYHASWSASGNEVVFRESLEVKAIISPPSDYGAVRDFFERVYQAQMAPAVLIRR